MNKFVHSKMENEAKPNDDRTGDKKANEERKRMNDDGFAQSFDFSHLQSKTSDARESKLIFRILIKHRRARHFGAKRMEFVSNLINFQDLN